LYEPKHKPLEAWHSLLSSMWSPIVATPISSLRLGTWCGIIYGKGKVIHHKWGIHT